MTEKMFSPIMSYFVPLVLMIRNRNWNWCSFFQEISYSNLLEPSYSNSNSYLPLDTEPSDTQTGPVSPRQIQLPGLSQNHDENGGGGAWGVAVGTPYSPHMVDGWLVAGKHSRLIPFHGYIVSSIFSFKSFFKPKEIFI